MTGLALILGVSLALAAERPARIIGDFEADTYGDWKAEGEAFGNAPARGTLKGQMHVSEFKGRGLVNTYLQGDGSLGTLTSPPFLIDRSYISFLIGGGGVEGVSMNLLVDGTVLRTAKGPNTTPGGSEALEPASWDVRDLEGRSAQIQIIDQAKGGWGHINVDHIVLSDTLPPQPLRNWSCPVVPDKRYLLFPVKNGGLKRHVELRSGNQVLRAFTLELGGETHDWQAPLEVSAWTGQSLTVWIDRCDQVPVLKLSDDPALGEGLYNEPRRAQFHFSPQLGWNNDPNGLCYYNREYHLFFQHNPYGRTWGNMHWGHAVSKDLLHWKELGDVLYPDACETMFSGSAVVDWKNTSGFGKDGRPPLVLIYTAAGQRMSQCIAASTDGRGFTKYAGNPVIAQRGEGDRDPKVFWHEATRRWIMVLYVGRNTGHTIELFASKDLKAWEFLSSVTGDEKGKGSFLYECPDFFELPIEGATDTRWVLFAANGQYAIGRFDGTTFTPEEKRLRGHFGSDYYAPQTFSDLPDRRRVILGWFKLPGGTSFNQGMTLPHELGLKQTPEGLRLTHKPIKELESLRSSQTAFTDAEGLASFTGELMEVRLSFDPSSNAVATLHVRGVRIVYDHAKGELAIDGCVAPFKAVQGKVGWIIYVDRVGVEVFSEDGLFYATRAVAPAGQERSVAFSVERGTITNVQGKAFKLNSIWSE